MDIFHIWTWLYMNGPVNTWMESNTYSPVCPSQMYISAKFESFSTLILLFYLLTGLMEYKRDSERYLW